MKFKTRAEVDHYLSGDKIECLLCNKMFKAVGGKHLAYMHGVSVEDYKKKFGLPMGRGLCAEETSKNHSAALRQRRDDGDESMNTMDAERMHKAQQAPKRKFPDYHVNHMKSYAKEGLKRIKARSKERVDSYDWDLYLEKMVDTKSARSRTRGKNGEPSEFHLKRKINTDPVFAKKYNALKKSFVLKYAKKADVLAMTIVPVI